MNCEALTSVREEINYVPTIRPSSIITFKSKLTLQTLQILVRPTVTSSFPIYLMLSNSGTYFTFSKFFFSLIILTRLQYSSNFWDPPSNQSNKSTNKPANPMAGAYAWNCGPRRPRQKHRLLRRRSGRAAENGKLIGSKKIEHWSSRAWESARQISKRGDRLGKGSAGDALRQIRGWLIHFWTLNTFIIKKL